jgi:hypothetical protein
MANKSRFTFYTWGRTLLSVLIEGHSKGGPTDQEIRETWASVAGYIPTEATAHLSNQLNWLCKRDGQWHNTHLGEALGFYLPGYEVLGVPTDPGWLEMPEEQKLYRLWAVDHLTRHFWRSAVKPLVVQYLEEVEYREGYGYWYNMFRYEGDARTKLDKRAVERDFLLCCGYDDTIDLSVFSSANQERIHKLLAVHEESVGEAQANPNPDLYAGPTDVAIGPATPSS